MRREQIKQRQQQRRFEKRQSKYVQITTRSRRRDFKNGDGTDYSKFEAKLNALKGTAEFDPFSRIIPQEFFCTHRSYDFIDPPNINGGHACETLMRNVAAIKK